MALLLRQRNERQRRELALDYAAGRLNEPAFLSAVAALRSEPEAPAPTPAVDAKDVAHYLTDIAGSLRELDKLTMSGDLSESERAAWWARMIAAVYARFTVVGTKFVEARLTAAAERHGLALALPEAVDAEWRARPDSNRRSPA